MSGAIKINGTSSGSTTITAPASGGDESIELSTALAAKGDVAGETWTGTHDFSGATLTGVPGGLVLVASASPSAAASVSIDSCFTTAYDNYRVMMYLDASTTVSVYARYRASGTDNTSAVNSWRRLYYDSSVVGTSSSSQTQMDIGVIRTGSPSQVVMDLSSPALAQEKVWTVLNREDGSARYIAGLSALNSAFDGMTFYPNTGTITGTIRVYGYQNS